MRRPAVFCLAGALAIAATTLIGAPAWADAIDDQPVEGLEPSRRLPPPPPMAAPPQPEPSPAGDPGWRFMVAPYLWLPAATGNSTVNGFKSDIDATFGDIFENFDVYGVMGRAEAHKDRFGGFLDVMWLNADGDFGTAAGFRVQPDVEQIKVDFGLMYEALRWDTSQGHIAISPLIGGRYAWLKQKIRFSGTPAPPTLGSRESWWEPFVGARLVWAISKPFDITLQGDVGGFGVGSDLSWQAFGGFGFRFTEWFKLNMGYYAYAVDYSSGGGMAKQGIDLIQHGPRIGFQFDL